VFFDFCCTFFIPAILEQRHVNPPKLFQKLRWFRCCGIGNVLDVRDVSEFMCCGSNVANAVASAIRQSASLANGFWVERF
jgi:hypothetical protein